MESIIIIMVIMFFIFVSIVGYLFSRYKTCPPDKILVVYGETGNSEHQICLHGGGRFIMPILQQYQYIDIVIHSINIQLENINDRNKEKFTISAIFNASISTDINILSKGMKNFNIVRQSSIEIENKIKEIITKQFELIIKRTSLNEKDINMEKLIEDTYSETEEELKKIGFHLINVNIYNID